MAFFRKIVICGVSHTLEHLNPFEFPFYSNSDNFVVRVEFSNHCFTEKRETFHTPDYHYHHKCKNGDKRAFSVERFEDSKGLPNLIRTLGNAPVYHSERKSFFFIRDAVAGNYVVFFRAFRSTKNNINVSIIVDSAYRKQNMVQFAPPVLFTNLIESTARSTRLPLGPRARIRRG